MVEEQQKLKIHRLFTECVRCLLLYLSYCAFPIILDLIFFVYSSMMYDECMMCEGGRGDMPPACRQRLTCG